MSARVFGRGLAVSPHERVADFARVQVRAGLLGTEALHAEVRVAVVAELPDDEPADATQTLVAQAAADLFAEQQDWERPTDYEWLQAAFGALEEQGVVVLQAVEDHWDADAALRRLTAAGRPPEGALWFTAPDVWHAVDHGILELNVWHGDTANVAPGDPLLDLVITTLASHGLAGHFDEGRVEVAARWRKPLPAHGRDSPATAAPVTDAPMKAAPVTNVET